MGAWNNKKSLGLKVDVGIVGLPNYFPIILRTFSITLPLHITIGSKVDWYIGIGAVFASFGAINAIEPGFAWNSGINWNMNRYFMLGFEIGGQYRLQFHTTISARFKFGSYNESDSKK